MDVKMKLAYILVDLILPIIAGYLLRSQHRFGDPFFKAMMNLNILVFMPTLSVLSSWILPLRMELAWLPLFGLLLGIVPGVTAYLGSAGKFKDDLEKGSYLISASLSNLGTIGGLSVFIILGEQGYAYSRLMMVLQDASLFLIFFPLAQYYYQKSVNGEKKAIQVANLFWSRNQFPVAGLIAGTVLYYSGIPRPAVLGMVFDPCVHLAAWTALMPIGFSLDLQEMRRYYRRILDLIPIKFIVNPCIAFLFARMFISDQTVINTIVIMSFTPTAINAVITAKLFGLNVNIAMAALILTTAIFLLVLFPALVYWIS